MALSKRSNLVAPWSSSSISGWRMRTSRPFFAISVAPRLTDLTSVEPDLAMRAEMTPVEMSMLPPRLSTVTFAAGTTGVPAVSVSLPLPELTACAVHLRVPSGQ